MYSGLKIVASIFLAALLGCSYGFNPFRGTAGSMFDVTRTRAVREGLEVSSLVDLLGQPFLVVPNDEPGETWYYFMRVEGGKLDFFRFLREVGIDN